jgi:hypothetical protein
VNGFVGAGDRLAKPFGHGTGLTFEPAPHGIDGDLGRTRAAGLPAHPIHDDENAAYRIGVEPIFVLRA